MLAGHEDDFGPAWAEWTVAALAEAGVEFASGLDPGEIGSIEAAFGTVLPSELSTLLGVAVPISEGWAPWTDGASAVVAAARAWIDHTFEFDITANGYWHALFGTRPTSSDEAIAQALDVVRSAPPLLPIYGHRYLASSADGPRPVLSVWQAVDSIIYGNDLADYFATEFHIERPSWAASTPAAVPIWDDLFEL